MIEYLGGDHKFVGARPLDECLDACMYSFRRADNGARQRVVEHGLGLWLDPVLEALDGGWQLAGPPGAEIHKGLLQGGEQLLRLRVGLGGHDVQAEHDVGLVQLRRRLEPRAVECDAPPCRAGAKCEAKA